MRMRVRTRRALVALVALATARRRDGVTLRSRTPTPVTT